MLECRAYRVQSLTHCPWALEWMAKVELRAVQSKPDLRQVLIPCFVVTLDIEQYYGLCLPALLGLYVGDKVLSSIVYRFLQKQMR